MNSLVPSNGQQPYRSRERQTFSSGVPYEYRTEAAHGRSSQLFEYWLMVRRRSGMIFLLAVAGSLVGFTLASLQPQLYRARTVLDIRNLNENVLSMRDNAPMGASGNVLPESYLQTEIKILQSDSILKKAVERIPAQKAVRIEPRGLIEEIKSTLHLGDRPAMAELIADASQRIKIRALGNTRIVEILCDARDGQIAADVCNSLAKTYIEHNLESRFQSTSETSQWLSSQLDSVRRRLTKAEGDLKDSARESALLGNGELENPAQERLHALQNELTRAQAERIAKQSQYEIVLTSSPDSLPIGLDAGPIREYRLHLSELRRQMAELSATMTPKHARIRELSASIADIEADLQKERTNLTDRLKTEYDEAKRREAMLTASYASQADVLAKYGDKAVHYNMLKREVDSGRRLYETLLQKVEEVGLAAAMRASTITIVDPATSSSRPYSPNPPFSIAMGLVLGMCVGIGLATMQSRADQTLRAPGDAPIQLQLRELGVIPSGKPRSFVTVAQRTRHTPLIDVNGADGEPSNVLELAAWRENPPAIAEAFLGTMNSLLFTIAGSQTRVIVITSPSSGDGKTTVAANIAISLARTNKRVVLLEGDLRKPRLNQLFRVSPEGGLADLLEDTEPLTNVAKDQLAKPTAVKNLYLLPSRPVPNDISAKLHSDRLATLLRQLRSEFDMVVIDSPPMLHISDARVLGWLADGVVLVFRAGKTTREAANAATECLEGDGIRLVGTILNDWNPIHDDKYGSYPKYAYSGSKRNS